MTLAIRGGTILTDGLEMKADLLVADGVVVALADGAHIAAERTLDATGCFVLPGLLDLDPLHDLGAAGHHPAEVLGAATRALLGGGVTTIALDLPAAADPDDFEAAASASATNIAWRAEVVKNDGSRRRAVEHVRAGKAAGARASLRRLGPAADALPEGELFALLRDMAPLRPVVVFPEHGALGDLATAESLRGATAPSPLAEHPQHLMRAGLRLLASLQEQRVAPIVAHPVTSASDVDLLLEIREQTGHLLMAMTCAPYLLFYAQDEQPAPGGKLPAGYPPLRRKPDAVALWKALEAGLIDVIASGLVASSDDALGYPRALLPALHAQACVARHLPWSAFLPALTDNPAKLLGLWPRKGSLQVGADADIVVFDPEAAPPPLPASSPYTTLTLAGNVRAVLRRGELVACDGNANETLAPGEVLRPSPAEVRKG